MSDDSQKQIVIFPADLLSELRKRVMSLWEEGRTQTMKTADSPERRAMAQETLKRVAREVFLTQPTATEEDFERCWPKLRDRIFLEYTLDLAASLIIPDKEIGV